MKKYINIISVILSIVLLFTGCVFGESLTNAPDDHPSSIWVSTSPDIWVYINREEIDEPPPVYKGELTIDGKTTPISMWFFHDLADDSFYGTISDDNYPDKTKKTKGVCHCFPDMFVFEITSDDVFGGKYSTIVFKRMGKEYPIQEMDEYFKGNHLNEILGFQTNKEPLTYDKVNSRFPASTKKTEGYSVYQIKEGGFYYVFWANAYDEESTKDVQDSVVYFSSYLSEEKYITSFDSLKANISTAKDALSIDPYLEISFAASSEIFSYSFLNKESVLKIEYSAKAQINSYEDLIIKEITVMPRKDSASIYQSISAEDLP